MAKRMEVVPGAWSDVVMCPHCGHGEMLGVGQVIPTCALCAKCNLWGYWVKRTICTAGLGEILSANPIPAGAMSVWLDNWIDHTTVCD